MTENTTPAETGFSYTLTRTLDAPVHKVWQAWTTAEQYAQWFGAAPGSVSLDVRPGGAWKATLVVPDGSGTQIPMTGTYVEVVEDRRLVVGMDGPQGPDPAVMMLELTDRGGRTEIALSQTCATAEQRDQSEEGSTMLLDSLTTFLAAS